MNVLPFTQDVKPLQTNIWTFEVAGRVFSVQLDFWFERDAPSKDYPFCLMPGVLTTAKLIDWISGATYGPRALGSEVVSLEHESHQRQDQKV